MAEPHEGATEDAVEPHGVFCSNPQCPHYAGNAEASPAWNHDCPVRDGVPVCEACGAPMVRRTGWP